MSGLIYKMLKWPLFFCAIYLCCTESTKITEPVAENSPPEFLTGFSDTGVVAGRPITLQVIVKDDDGDTLTLSTAAKPSGSTFDPLTGEFYWKPDLELDVIGEHPVVFTASDNDTTVVDSIFIDVTAGASPVFTCKDSAKTNAGFAMQFTLKAMDADKDILKYFARTLPDTGIKIDSLSGLLTWKPSAALVNTAKTCVVYVTDGLTEDTLPLTISILAPTKLLVPDVFWKIQPAVDAAQSGDTVFVDTGTYAENVDFKGKVIIMISRYTVGADPAMIDKTIIDGMDKAPVIMINNCGAGTAVIGFTLQKGRGNGNQGGGVHINKTPALIEHCVIKDSRSEGGWTPGGGGVRSMDANATIKNCTFKNNDGRYFGGGIFFGQENVNNITKPTVDSCIIIENKVDQGGAGVYAVHALPKITNTIIANNTGDYANAVFGSHAEITLQGCVIYGNKSTKSTVALGSVEGGADGRGKLLINHCTVADNVTTADTSLGVYAVFLEKESKNNVITNSIFWNNTGRFISDSVNAVVSYCAIQNGYPGDTIITADPLLDSTYTLKPGSPCIDKASDGTDIGAIQSSFSPLLARARRMTGANRYFVPGQRPQNFCSGQHLYPPMCR